MERAFETQFYSGVDALEAHLGPFDCLSVGSSRCVVAFSGIRLMWLSVAIADDGCSAIPQPSPSVALDARRMPATSRDAQIVQAWVDEEKCENVHVLDSAKSLPPCFRWTARWYFF